MIFTSKNQQGGKSSESNWDLGGGGGNSKNFGIF